MWPSRAAMFWLRDAYGCAGATLVGLLVNFVAARVLPTKKVGGSPQWTWYLGRTVQVCVFPSLTYLAWANAGFDWEWLGVGWNDRGEDSADLSLEDDPMRHERIYLYAMFGYMAKDYLLPVDMLFVVHHTVCALAAVGAFFMPSGVGTFITCVTVMEAGSCSFSFLQTRPYLLYRVVFYIIMHTTSNVAAVVLTYWLWLLPGTAVSPLPVKYGLPFVSLSLAAVRQWICYNDARAWFTAEAKEERRLAREAARAAKAKRAT